MQPAFYPLYFTLLVTGVAAVWDLRTGLIPNRLLFAGAAGGLLLSLVVAALSGDAPSLLRVAGLALAGALLVALVPLLLYRAGGLGGGDVKLLALVGALLGPSLGLEAELYAFSLTLLYAPARLIWEGKLLVAMRNLGRLIALPFVPRQRRPQPAAASEFSAFRFGPAIFLGTLIAVGLRFTPWA